MYTLEGLHFLFLEELEVTPGRRKIVQVCYPCDTYLGKQGKAEMRGDILEHVRVSGLQCKLAFEAQIIDYSSELAQVIKALPLPLGFLSLDSCLKRQLPKGPSTVSSLMVTNLTHCCQ